MFSGISGAFKSIGEKTASLFERKKKDAEQLAAQKAKDAANVVGDQVHKVGDVIGGAQQSASDAAKSANDAKASAIDALDKELSKVTLAAGEAKDAATKAVEDGKKAVNTTKDTIDKKVNETAKDIGDTVAEESNTFVGGAKATINSTVGLTVSTAQSAINTGFNYANVAKDAVSSKMDDTQKSAVNIAETGKSFAEDTVASTVDSTKKAVETAVDTGRTYIESAKDTVTNTLGNTFDTTKSFSTKAPAVDNVSLVGTLLLHLVSILLSIAGRFMPLPFFSTSLYLRRKVKNNLGIAKDTINNVLGNTFDTTKSFSTKASAVDKDAPLVGTLLPTMPLPIFSNSLKIRQKLKKNVETAKDTVTNTLGNTFDITKSFSTKASAVDNVSLIGTLLLHLLSILLSIAGRFMPLPFFSNSLYLRRKVKKNIGIAKDTVTNVLGNTFDTTKSFSTKVSAVDKDVLLVGNLLPTMPLPIFSNSLKIQQKLKKNVETAKDTGTNTLGNTFDTTKSFSTKASAVDKDVPLAGNLLPTRPLPFFSNSLNIRQKLKKNVETAKDTVTNTLGNTFDTTKSFSTKASAVDKDIPLVGNLLPTRPLPFFSNSLNIRQKLKKNVETAKDTVTNTLGNTFDTTKPSAVDKDVPLVGNLLPTMPIPFFSNSLNIRQKLKKNVETAKDTVTNTLGNTFDTTKSFSTKASALDNDVSLIGTLLLHLLSILLSTAGRFMPIPFFSNSLYLRRNVKKKIGIAKDTVTNVLGNTFDTTKSFSTKPSAVDKDVPLVGNLLPTMPLPFLSNSLNIRQKLKKNVETAKDTVTNTLGNTFDTTKSFSTKASAVDNVSLVGTLLLHLLSILLSIAGRFMPLPFFFTSLSLRRKVKKNLGIAKDTVTNTLGNTFDTTKPSAVDKDVPLVGNLLPTMPLPFLSNSLNIRQKLKKNVETAKDTVTNTLGNTFDTTKSFSTKASAVDNVSLVGTLLLHLLSILLSIAGRFMPLPFFFTSLSLRRKVKKNLGTAKDTVTHTMGTTIDNTKSLAGSAVHMGMSMVGSAKDTVTNTVGSTIDTTKSLAGSAVDKGFSMVGNAKDTVTNTVGSTVDTTKSLAGSAVDKGFSMVGSAKETVTNTVGSTIDTTKSLAGSAVDKGFSFVGSAKETVTHTVGSTVDTTKSLAGSAVDKGFSMVGSAKDTFANTISSGVETTKNIAAGAVGIGVSAVTSAKDTVSNTVGSTIDTTKSLAGSAVDKGVSIVGTAKDTVTNTINTGVESTYNMAASAVDKGYSAVGAAKDTVSNTVGSTYDATLSFTNAAFEKGTSLAGNVKDTVTHSVQGTVDTTTSFLSTKTDECAKSISETKDSVEADVQDKLKDVKSVAHATIGNTKSFIEQAKETISHKVEDIKDLAKKTEENPPEVIDDAKDAINSTVDNTKKAAEEAKEQARKAAEAAKEEAKRVANATIEESKKAADKAAADAAAAVNNAVDDTLKRVENAADEGIKNAGQVVDGKIKEADKYINTKRDTLLTNFSSTLQDGSEGAAGLLSKGLATFPK